MEYSLRLWFRFVLVTDNNNKYMFMIRGGATWSGGGSADPGQM